MYSNISYIAPGAPRGLTFSLSHASRVMWPPLKFSSRAMRSLQINTP